MKGFLVLVLNLSQAFAGETPAGACIKNDLKSRFESFRGTNHEVLLPAQRGVLDISEIFGDQDQVFLGVAKSGHYYLSVGNTRVEGAFFPIPAYKFQGRVSEGYLFHFPNVPAETIKKWQTEMARKRTILGFSLSCVSQSCSALREGFGIQVGGGHSVHSGPTLANILQRGFVDEKGHPVPFTIYQTSPKVPEFGTLATHLARQDGSYTQISLAYMGLTAGGGLVGILVAANKFKSPHGIPGYQISGGKCYASEQNGRASGEPQADYLCRASYRVSGNRCYMADSNGVAYGSPQEDYLCRASYRKATNGKCYMTSSKGETYGRPQEDRLCTSSFRVSSKKCYMADTNGVIYGEPQADHFCLASFRMANKKCYMADDDRERYGKPQADHFCLASFRVANKKCYMADDDRETYGEPQDEKLCESIKSERSH